MEQLLSLLSRERPVGTDGNTAVNDFLQTQLEAMGFKLVSLPFACHVREKGPSYADVKRQRFAICPCPFSPGFTGQGRLVLVQIQSELENADCTHAVLLLAGSLVKSPLMPKNYPFYYPDDHRRLIELLEAKSPRAVIALTARHPLCGLKPYLLFEDGNFPILAAYTDCSNLLDLKKYIGQIATLKIDSQKVFANSRQLMATKSGKRVKEKVTICARMDTKYQTPGALDNATGVAVLLETAKRLTASSYSIDIVPFNGEEYYEASGELAYLRYSKERNEKVRLFINIDAPCLEGSPNALSVYNLSKRHGEIATQALTSISGMVSGDLWYAGDPSVFAFSRTPGLALTTQNLEEAIRLSHTFEDTLENIDAEGIIPAAEGLALLIDSLLEVGGL